MDAMDPRGDLYWTNLAQASGQKRGHAEAFGLTGDNDKNQPAQKRVCTPQIGAALLTQPAATTRAHAESFDPLFDEVEMEPAPEKARLPLAPVTVNTPSVEVYNDEDDDLASLFGGPEEEDNFCSSEDLEDAMAEQAKAVATEAQAKEMAEQEASYARQEERRKQRAAAAKAAKEKAQAEAAATKQAAAEKAQAETAAAAKQAAETAKQQNAVARAVAKQARRVARNEAAKKAAEDAEKEKEAEAFKANEKEFYAKQWKEVMDARESAPKQSSPNSSKTTSVPKVNSSSPVIDLTDDEPAASQTCTKRSPALPKSSPVVIDLSEDDSNESKDSSQQNSSLRHGTEAALRVPSPDERLTPCLDDLEFSYNTNGFPLQQAKMVCRRTTKQERAAKLNLGSHIKELDLPESMKLHRELLNHTIANSSISINGQKNVKDTIVPLVESLHTDALQSIHYIDGSMHLLSDSRLLADRCQIRGIKLAVEELRVQPTWLWTAPGWHKFVCLAGAKDCRGRRCACKKISKKEGKLPEPEVRDVDVKRLLVALGLSTNGETFLEEMVLRHGIKTLSECLTWTKVLSINLGFHLDDFKMSMPSIMEARDNLLDVDDKYRLVFRKRLESQDCELILRFATEEEKQDSVLSYQQADAEVLEWLETLPTSTEI